MRHVIVVGVLAAGLAACGESCQGESMVDQLSKAPPQFDAAPRRPASQPDPKFVKDFVRSLFKKKEENWTPEERELFKQYVAELRAFDKKNKRPLVKLAKDYESSFRDLLKKETELRGDAKRLDKLQLWWDNTFSARVQTLIVETGKLCPRGDESMLVPDFYELHEMMKIQLPDSIQSLWSHPEDKSAKEQFEQYRRRGDELCKKMQKHIGQIDQK
jgi:hypothetical protein